MVEVRAPLHDQIAGEVGVNPARSAFSGARETGEQEEVSGARRTMAKARRGCRRAAFALAGRWPWRVSIPRPERLTVVLPVFHAVRARNLTPQIRALRRCAFVDRIIISNHNPDLTVEDHLGIGDRRISVISQETRAGAGKRWDTAIGAVADYILVIDDDLCIFPGQIARLFKRLIEDPSIPHGLVGTDRATWHQEADLSVDILHEIYAVTGAHVQHYFELNDELNRAGVSSDVVEWWADDIVISRCGETRPRIHNLGRILRTSTADEAGIAVHRAPGFVEKRASVLEALPPRRMFSDLDRQTE